MKGGERESGGGLLLTYIYIPEVNYVYLLDVYDKDEKANLTAQEKREFRVIANEISRAVIQLATSRARYAERTK
jgi:hypothetical protein